MNADKLIAYRQITESEHVARMAVLDQIIAAWIAHDCPVSTDGQRLDVPWMSQLGDSAGYAPGDCGTAVLASWLNFLEHDVTVDQVSQATKRPPGFRSTWVGDLVKAASNWDLSLIWSRNKTLLDLYAQIDAGKPVIVLVYYKALPVRFDPNYPYCHWILVTGYGGGKLWYHDPYYWTPETGANIEISEQDFLVAWSQNYKAGNSNRQMLSEAN